MNKELISFEKTSQMDPNVRTILSTITATIAGVVILPISQLILINILPLDMYMSPLPYGIMFLLSGITIGALSAFIDPDRKLSYVISVVFVIVFSLMIVSSGPGLGALLFPLLLGLLIMVTSSFSVHARISRGIIEKRGKK